MKHEPWDHRVAPLALPHRFHMVLGEVDAGSNTPSMVSQVLKWKAANPEQGFDSCYRLLTGAAQTLWQTLDEANQKVTECFSGLGQLFASDATAYNDALDIWLSSKASNHTPPSSSATATSAVLAELFESFQVFLVKKVLPRRPLGPACADCLTPQASQSSPLNKLDSWMPFKKSPK